MSMNLMVSMLSMMLMMLGMQMMSVMSNLRMVSMMEMIWIMSDGADHLHDADASDVVGVVNAMGGFDDLCHADDLVAVGYAYGFYDVHDAHWI